MALRVVAKAHHREEGDPMSEKPLEGRRIAFVGLGQIGGPLATHLLSDGAYVKAYRRTASKLAAWGAENPDATLCESVAEACEGVDILITCVGNDQDLLDVFEGEQSAMGALQKGTLCIDHTTASPALARHLSDLLARKDISFVDAPVSGGSSGALNRALSIMLGGSDDSVLRASPILKSYGKNVSHIGDVGAGQLCKMVNQICIAGVLEGLAEGLAVAKSAGMDTKKVLQAISGGAAGSWQMQNRSGFMLDQKYPAGFAAQLMHKDLSLALSVLDDLGIDAPVARVVQSRYSEILAKGLGHEDFSNLYRLTNGH
jgi:3-hydroxyisobutyrate dehydrogenase-like beta-hydroxyacid dehydrogenase